MALVKVLTTALLFCSLPSIGQVTSSSTQTPDLGTKAAQSVEPWRIVPDKATIQDPWTRILSAHPNADPAKGDSGFDLHLIPAPNADKIALWPEGEYGGDSVCFTIRSYVVARDNKNSDSVHPVSYSTCQPATRYRLKEAVIHTDSSDK